MTQKVRYTISDVTMGAIASRITSLTIVYSTIYLDVDQRKHQSSASLAFVREIHRGPVNSPHNGPVTRKLFSFDDVIMTASMSNSDSLLIQIFLMTYWSEIQAWINKRITELLALCIQLLIHALTLTLRWFV